ncbi:HWE histidine kinase domain-containing protein [Sphingomonas sp. CROZ-RG-20F-R02-07]|uniref:sensor histidine kinase n=1 Tax=Sphingomonas sp. CROZ-RG-20F-R02-07 TaxID=2914832 RepID=UPI001F56FD77|nr:HWE histidine kinase domain-containing protein [Sphingomonas sp. CROZ-RG-20F-R02-07]
MAASTSGIHEDERSRLLDENEQLRTSLESALEENSRTVEDRDRLLRRVTVLARELQAANTAQGVLAAATSAPGRSTDESEFKQSQAHEELQVAFEGLQVLSEELEVANTNLERANEDLEGRIQARTREITATNAALRRTELRLTTLIEGMPQLVWRAADGGEWTWASSQWTGYTGLSDEDSRGMGWLEAFHPDDRQAALDAWSRAEKHDGLSFEARLCQAGKGYRHFQTRATPVRTPDGAVLEWLGTSTDVDDIIRLQEQQSVLMNELQHRTRNLMAVVQAVMLRTLRGSSSLEEFRRCIDDRMSALARVQGLLSRRGAHRVAFDALLREELGAHLDLDADGNAPQMTLSGPRGVPLESSLVQTFALALHELATNAAKYGALATPAGHLTVRWEVVANDKGEAQLHVDWRETGVADLPAPGDKPRGGGYGRELIERALPYQMGAKTSFAFTGDGVHCTIRVDVPRDSTRREAHHVRTPA